MGKVSFTLRMDEEVKAELDALAVAQDRPVAWVVNRAVEAVLAAERDLVERIERAEASIEEHGTVPFEDVTTWMDARDRGEPVAFPEPRKA